MASKPERRKATDHDVVMRVVNILGLIAGGLVLTIFIGVVTGKPVDAALSGLAGTTFGYLGGILTNAFRGQGNVAQPVEVTNSADNAVPVEPAGNSAGQAEGSN